jgi:PAS domain S-box-containing protein
VPRRRSPVLRQWLWLLVASVALLAAVVHGDWLWRADLGLYDAMLPAGPVAGDVIVVGIDEPSLKAIGRWPWRRSVHAALLGRLQASGAKAVALDFLFTEAEKDGDDDAGLAAAMAAGLPVVLPVAPELGEDGALTETLPIQLLARAARGLGHAELEIDGDGIVRSVYLRAGPGAPSRSHLAVALLVAGGDAQDSLLTGERNPHPTQQTGNWVRDYRFRIPFAGPAGTMPHVSFIDALNGWVPADTFRDKLVLVGLTGLGLPDAYPTPRSAYGVAMPGVEITANVVSALRHGKPIRRATRTAEWVLDLLPVLAALVGFLLLRPRQSLMLVAALLMMTALAALLLLREAGFWWPPTAALAALVLLYPLWSWRRLEAAQEFLEAEFATLRDEPLPRPVPDAAAPAARLDPFRRQIEVVREAAERLREVRRLFADTVRSLPDATVVVDLQGRIVLANPEAASVLGLYGDQQLEGRLVDAALVSELTGQVLEFAALAARAPCTLDYRSARLERDFLVRVVPFEARDGARLGTILDLADITELRRLQRERDEVIGFLSHDMKGPAASLAGLARLQRDPERALPPAALAERLDTLAQRTLSLVDGFLGLARAEAADPLVFRRLPLHDAVQDAVDEVWAAAAARGIKIDWAMPAAATEVIGDRALLARAVGNLLGNAVKFAADHTVVRVRQELRGPQVAIVVADQGPGIPEEGRAALFRRYARGLHDGGADPGGAGLGLAFVSAVAGKHSGEVAVQSEVGVGSTFTLILPVAAAPGGN